MKSFPVRCSIIVVSLEIFQLALKVLLIGLSAWQYFSMTSYPKFSFKDYSSCSKEYSCTTEAVAFVMGIALLLGLTVLLPLQAWILHSCTNPNEDARWRPAVILYIFFCALPCKALLLAGLYHVYVNENGEVARSTMVLIQFIIFGLTVTTWLSKLSHEMLTYKLIEDASEDFFFAYDVYDIYDKLLSRNETNSLSWLYVTIIFGFLAMFKFLPHRPTDLPSEQSIYQAKLCIYFSMFFNDFPFVMIRISSWVQYGLSVTDLIHPFKNIGFIILGFAQINLLNERKIEAEIRDED